MRLLQILLLLHVAAFFPIAAQNIKVCPTLEVIVPPGPIFPTRRVTVVARLTGDVGTGEISYEWKTTGGRIVSGQGTPAIVFYAGEDDQSRNVELTATARGPLFGCNVNGSSTVGVGHLPEFDPMDEWGRVGSTKMELWDFLSRVDSFLAAVAGRPGSEGFIVIDFNSKDSTKHKIQHLKRIFDHVAFRKFDLARFTIGLSEHIYPEKTTFMGTFPPKARVPRDVRGYKIINAEDYRTNISSLFPLSTSANRTLRKPPTVGPDRFWYELPAGNEDFQRELDAFFEELENNPDHEGIVEITYRSRGKQTAEDELIGRVQNHIDKRQFDRTRISYYSRIGLNNRIRIIRVPPESNYDYIGIDRSKLIKAEEYNVRN